MKKTAILLLTLILTIACRDQASPDETPTVIRWDTWGVPHISASSDEGLFFADGWAQMHAHANTILHLYGVSRGRAAEYWGKQHLDSDRLVRTLGHPQQAVAMWPKQDPKTRQLLSAYVAGLNAYAAQHPEAIKEENRVVLPITVDDTNMHTLFVVNTRFIAGRELQMSAHWDETGSNTLAIGPSRSAHGHAMLVQNPHLPWFGEFLFFEKHLLKPGKNIYGVTLVGLPGVSIAFNDHLGWSHTNNTIDNADLFELTLVGDGYLYDGVQKAFQEETTTLRVKEENGGFSEQEFTVQRSVHGPVIRKIDGRALALRHVGNNIQDNLLQSWNMANANNFEEFEAALKMAQLPYWNVMYADREGNIFYLFNGLVPVRANGDWDYWQDIVPGDDSGKLWTDVHPYQDLPRILNPDTGWLQNANDAPWTSTLPMQLDADEYPSYMAPRLMYFRAQHAASMMLEDDSISFEELIEYKHDTRMEMAERILDDLLAALDQHGTGIAREAKAVLEQWDRKADIDSRGAALFYNWAMKMNPYKQENYAVPWDEEAPVSTPDGLADPAAMARLLESVATEMQEQYGRLDVPWGEVNRIEYNGHSWPANGANGAVGVFRVAAAGVAVDGVQTIRHGDSWVAVIEFAETTRARVLLSYGNSTQEGSPHFGDQLALFSQKKLREAWRTEQQLHGNIEKTERLQDGVFVEVDKNLR